MSNEQKDLAALNKAVQDLAARVDQVEKLASETADQVDKLADAGAGAAKSTAPRALDVKDPLHPAKAGQAEYEEHKRKLMMVKPHEKGYADAQAQLRAAGIVQ